MTTFTVTPSRARVTSSSKMEMFIQQHPSLTSLLHLPAITIFNPLHTVHLSHSPPHLRLSVAHLSIRTLTLIPKAKTDRDSNPTSEYVEYAEEDADDRGDEVQNPYEFPLLDDEGGGEGGGEEEEEFSFPSSGYRGRVDEKDYDRDPEFAEIIGSCFDDPKKAQERVEERIRRKRNKILHMKTGSAVPVKVMFNKFEFSSSYIWFEFHNAPLEKDISLICNAIRSWHIVGRLGGCNSMNMQLSQSPLDNKRPSYDAIQGANVTPTTFYNISDLEVQDNLARIWVDIGTSEPLLLDVLINALTNISSDYVGIKQLVFGGKEFENWKESFTAEDPGCSIHKI